MKKNARTIIQNNGLFGKKKQITQNAISVAYQFAVIMKEPSRRSCGHLVNIKAFSVKKLRNKDAIVVRSRSNLPPFIFWYMTYSLLKFVQHYQPYDRAIWQYLEDV